MKTRPTTAAGGGRAKALRRGLAILLFGGTAALAAHDWLDLGDAVSTPAWEALYDAVVIGAGLACIARASSYRRERSAWLLIGAAILAWGAGEVYWALYIEGNPSAPYPSPADLGYLAFYPLSYAGLAMLVKARTEEIDWRLWMDGLIAALGTAALGAAFVFDFVASKATGTSLEIATTLAYPLGDIAMLALVVGAVALTGWRPGRTWSLLLAGLAALVIADIAYTLQSTGSALPGGEWINPIYLAAAVCLAAAVWQPTEATKIAASAPGNRRREIVVPAVFASVMIGLFAMQYFSATSALSTVLWGATMTAVVARLAMSDIENKALLEQVRTDSLTGLGNRGRLQVELEQRCAAASKAQPLMLCLFDLNGFKLYNDTFGHPAGDELLARLGTALQSAIGEDGMAYRIGGDEFCVLLTCAPRRFDAVLSAMGRALEASEKGVEVSSSWGGARVPAEATSPAEALQLADVRMYAQKESRRTLPPTLGASEPLEQQLERAPDLDAR